MQNQEDNGWVRRICWTWSQPPKISWQELHFFFYYCKLFCWRWYLEWCLHSVECSQKWKGTICSVMHLLLVLSCGNVPLWATIASVKCRAKYYKWPPSSINLSYKLPDSAGNLRFSIWDCVLSRPYLQKASLVNWWGYHTMWAWCPWLDHTSWLPARPAEDLQLYSVP